MDQLKNNSEVNLEHLVRVSLEEGEEYMYSELCRALGIRTYKHGSNGYNTQIKALFNARHIEEVDGIYRGRTVKKYRIGKPKEAVVSLDGERGSKISPQKKSMYFYLLEFLYSLARDGTHAEYYRDSDMWKVTLSNNSLFKGVQMVNRNNYDIALYDPKHFCEYVGVNADVFSEVMGAMTSNNSITIYKMLQKLESLDLIYFVKTAIIGNNKIIIDSDEHKEAVREANFIENGKIRKIKRSILNDMNMIDETDVYIKGKRAVFYNKLKNQLYSEMGIEYYCPVYNITFDKKTILGFIEMLRNNPDIDMNLESNSDKFVKNLKKNCNKRRINAFNSKSNRITPKKAARMLECYGEHSSKILDNLHVGSTNIPRSRKKTI